MMFKLGPRCAARMREAVRKLGVEIKAGHVTPTVDELEALELLCADWLLIDEMLVIQQWIAEADRRQGVAHV